MSDLYQTKNFRKQINEAGGDVWMVNGVLGFYDEEFTGSALRGIARNTNAAITITNLSTASTVLSEFVLGDLSTPLIPSTVTTIFLSCTGTMTNGSAKLFSALKGQELYIGYTVDGGGSTASLWLIASGNTSGLSGVRLIASTGSDLSALGIRQSAASFGWARLQAIDDGIWAVCEGNEITENYA